MYFNTNTKMSNGKSRIAKNIKRLGKQQGLSQGKLSKLANLPHNTIIKIESGAIQSPAMDTAHRIARALGVSLDD
ncbi:MAG: helix-turn-helix domain-containing protein [bacterium]